MEDCGEPNAPLNETHEQDALLQPASQPQPSESHSGEAPPNNCPDDNDENQQRVGYLFMLLATLGFSLMYVLERYSQAMLGLSSPRALMIRAVVQTALAVLGVPLLNEGNWNPIAGLAWKTKALLCFRGVVGAATLTLHMYAMRLVPAGEVTSILFTSPVFTMAFAYLAIGEGVTWTDVGASAVSVVGGVLVVSPWSGGSHEAISRHDRVVGSAFAVGASVLGAVTYTVVRKLGARINFMSSVLALGVFSAAVAALLHGWVHPAELVRGTKDGAGVRWMVWSGLFGFIGQCGLNRGLQLCRAGRGMLIRNVDVPVVYALTITLLGEAPSATRGIGAALIVASAIAAALAKG